MCDEENRREWNVGARHYVRIVWSENIEQFSISRLLLPFRHLQVSCKRRNPEHNDLLAFYTNEFDHYAIELLTLPLPSPNANLQRQIILNELSAHWSTIVSRSIALGRFRNQVLLKSFPRRVQRRKAMIWDTLMTYEANCCCFCVPRPETKRELARLAKLWKSQHWIREEKWFMGTLIGKTSYSKCFSDKHKTRFICWVDSRQFMHVICYEIYSRSPQHLAMRQLWEWSFKIL